MRVFLLICVLVTVVKAFRFSYVPRNSLRPQLLMSANGRIPLVAGNWKMNTDLKSAVQLASELVELTKDADPSKVEVAVIPPFPFIRDVIKVAI